MSKIILTSDVDPDLCMLQDDELDAVVGGYRDGGCILLPTVPTEPSPTDGNWEFRDLFAKYTIG